MTVTIGRRELLAAFGCAAAAWPLAAGAQQRPVPAALRYLVGPLITADKSDNIRTSSWYLSPERGTEAGTCTLICAKVQSEWSAVQSQIENYRAKAKEFARLSVIAKSLRHSRQYRKLAEMYWALALGGEPNRAEPSKIHVERTT